MMHYGYYVENDLFWGGIARCHEGVSLSLWARLAMFADTIVDVGANTGLYTLVARAAAPTARVVSFEPMADPRAKLETNLRLNDYFVDVRPEAVSDSDGTANLHFSPGAFNYSASLDAEFATFNSDRISVPTVTLHSFCHAADIQKIDLIKIDVEGCEAAVLRGMGPDLLRSGPTILVEILSDTAGELVERETDGLGYRVFDLDEKHAPEPRKHIRKSMRFNYLLCRPDIAAKLGL
jgi:FkbM family methyltransferase